jgi:hypothetical protein
MQGNFTWPVKMTSGKGKAAIAPQGKGKATAVQPVTMTPGKSQTATVLPVTTTASKGKPGKAVAASDKPQTRQPSRRCRRRLQRLYQLRSRCCVMPPTVPTPVPVPALVLVLLQLVMSPTMTAQVLVSRQLWPA